MHLLVTREDYYTAATDILQTDGVSHLKIKRLCEKLKVTTGSFYGYFGSLDGFVGEYLAHWEQAGTERLAKLANVPVDPAERIHALKELAGHLPHAAEAAIRGWAHTNSQVAQAQRRVDARRLQVLTNLLLPGASSRREAKAIAMVGITLLVGLPQWRSPVTDEDFSTVFDEYERMVFTRIDEHLPTS